MTPEQLKVRTKHFALGIIALVGTLPRTLVAEIIARQIVRSGTSIGANYRAACRARSRAEFAARVAIALEEADETLYWLELLHDSGLFTGKSLNALMSEAGELVAIFAASHKTSSASRGSKTRLDE
jgi:four helix bundle protein